MKVPQLWLTLWDPAACSLPGSSVHGIFQARILEWFAMPSSRGSSQPRDLTQVSHIVGRFFTIWAITLVPSNAQTDLGQTSWESSRHTYMVYQVQLVWCYVGGYSDWYSPGHLSFSHSVMSDSLQQLDCSTPGLPVLHHLLEFAQIHVHWAGDAIQPSHPLSSPSPPAFNLSQYQGLFQWVGSLHQMTKVLELQLQHQSLQWIFRIDFL